MKGLIFINRYLVPKESVEQAERLKREFFGLGVETEIVSNGYINCDLKDGKLRSDFNADFGIFLDKDKYLSEVLEKTGLRLFNSHNSIRLCDDKAETYLALSGIGLNIPDTVFGALCYDSGAKLCEADCDRIIKKTGLPVIIKESFGSMGKNVYLAKDKKELLFFMEKVRLKPHLFQRYMGEKRGTDVRIIVIGGKAVGAMERHNDNDFRSNVALNGTCKKINADIEFVSCAEKCAKVLGLDYCGVDLLYGNGGKPYVCEVNSNAFFFGFEKATGINVAKIYAEYVYNTMNK